MVHLRATGRAHTKGDQVITVPDAEVMFTGDLVETGQFAIFPWFPPHDTDVSGIRWIKVLERLSAQNPRHVVPATTTSAARSCCPTSVSTLSCCAMRPGGARTRR